MKSQTVPYLYRPEHMVKGDRGRGHERRRPDGRQRPGLTPRDVGSLPQASSWLVSCAYEVAVYSQLTKKDEGRCSTRTVRTCPLRMPDCPECRGPSRAPSSSSGGVGIGSPPACLGAMSRHAPLVAPHAPLDRRGPAHPDVHPPLEGERTPGHRTRAAVERLVGQAPGNPTGSPPDLTRPPSRGRSSVPSCELQERDQGVPRGPIPQGAYGVTSWGGA